MRYVSPFISDETGAHEIKQFPQCQAASKWQAEDLNPDCLTPVSLNHYTNCPNSNDDFLAS